MGNYSLKNVFTQSPEKVKVTILAVLGVAAGLRGWDPDLLETVGVGIAIERVLDLFYVAPVRTGQAEVVAAAQAEEKTEKALQGIELGKLVARQRPLRPVDAAALVEEPPPGPAAPAPA